MAGKVTRDLFAEIQKLIPDLPDNVTELELKLSRDNFPVVTCEFIVMSSREMTDDFKRFEIREIEQTISGEPPASATKIG